MEEEEYRPRPDDKRVEPFFGGLAGARPEPESGAAGRTQAAARRGCGGAALLLAALTGWLWLG